MNSFNDLNEYLRAYRVSQALFAAYKIGLFDALEKAPQSRTELTVKLHVSERGIAPLLGVLKSLNIITYKKDKYQISRDFTPYLSPFSDQYIGNFIAHEIHLSKRWQHLTESIISGSPVKKESEKQSDSDISRFIRAMGSVGRRSAKLFCQKVPFKENEHILDLGGGPGEYQKLLCEKYSDITVTLFDQQETIQTARKTHETHPAKKRMKYKTGDFLKDDLGGPYHSIILSNIIHIYNNQIITDMLRKCNQSLKKDGRILIKDFIITDETDNKPFTHLFALHMLLSTENGKCYHYDELSDIMINAGFTPGHTYQITDSSIVVEGFKTQNQGKIYARF